jgi:hypothetical protein
VADAPRATDHTFGLTKINTEPQSTLSKRGIKDTPNVVEIGYMKTDIKPWAMSYVEANTSPTIRRKARIDMPGIRRYSQARRFAIERLNHYTLEDLEGQINVFEDGLKVQIGDVASITDAIGLTNKLARVMVREDQGHGRWALFWREYDPAAYSSVVETEPTSGNTGLPNPQTVQPITNLVANEVIYAEKDITPDYLARGLIY